MSINATYNGAVVVRDYLHKCMLPTDVPNVLCELIRAYLHPSHQRFFIEKPLYSKSIPRPSVKPIFPQNAHLKVRIGNIERGCFRYPYFVGVDRSGTVVIVDFKGSNLYKHSLAGEKGTDKFSIQIEGTTAAVPTVSHNRQYNLHCYSLLTAPPTSLGAYALGKNQIFTLADSNRLMRTHAVGHVSVLSAISVQTSLAISSLRAKIPNAPSTLKFDELYLYSHHEVVIPGPENDHVWDIVADTFSTRPHRPRERVVATDGETTITYQDHGLLTFRTEFAETQSRVMANRFPQIFGSYFVASGLGDDEYEGHLRFDNLLESEEGAASVEFIPFAESFADGADHPDIYCDGDWALQCSWEGEVRYATLYSFVEKAPEKLVVIESIRYF